MNQWAAMALDPSLILKAQGMAVDPWQRDLLLCQDRQMLLNCCRQAGKSTVSSALALHKALFTPGATVLILSPGQRQSGELFRRILNGYNAIGRPVKPTYETQLKIELENGSRIVCLPGKEGTIRGYSPDLLVIDEAAKVPEEVYRAARPMLAVSQGGLIALSTPYGQRGWFFNEWESKNPWKKVRVTWKECPRITADFIAQERASLGSSWVQQEYECLFTAMEGLVYPEFEKCYVDCFTPFGRPFGGIDWGWRNPFAAIWGVLDDQDVLWIQEERYLRETPLHEHSKALPKKVIWYADPAGATEIMEFRSAGHAIRKGDNDIRLGIAAVNARIQTGRLKVLSYRCPHLCSEAKLYRYPANGAGVLLGEKPLDENNHALGALRYLVSRLDGRFIAKLRKKASADGAPIEQEAVETIPIEETQAALLGKRNRLYHDEDAWTTLN